MRDYWLSKTSPGGGSQGSCDRHQNWRFGASCSRCLMTLTLMPKVRLLGGQITDIHFSLDHSGERSVGKATVSLDTSPGGVLVLR